MVIKYWFDTKRFVNLQYFDVKTRPEFEVTIENNMIVINPVYDVDRLFFSDFIALNLDYNELLGNPVHSESSIIGIIKTQVNNIIERFIDNGIFYQYRRSVLYRELTDYVRRYHEQKETKNDEDLNEVCDI